MRTCTLIGAFALALAGCEDFEDAPPDIEMAPLEANWSPPPPNDPTSRAREELGLVESTHAHVPPVCFSTGASETCAACHQRNPGAPQVDNPWAHAAEDPRELVDLTSEFGIVSWIRQDNYDALREEMTRLSVYDGFRPDLDLRVGFDEAGVAGDGSGWRSARAPAAAALTWPDAQSTSEVFYRLPPSAPAPDLAALEANAFPIGAELLQVLRYLDPDVPSGASVRVKEIRAMQKVAHVPANGARKVTGDALSGVDGGTGWRFSAFIEDEQGRLRLETDEELRSCVGCHSDRIAATTDSTFSFARASARTPRPFPSRTRALELGKAYKVLVERQRFDLGRETGLRPVPVPSARATTALR